MAKLFKCDSCNSEFSEKERLEIHKRVHNKKRKKEEPWTPNYNEYNNYNFYQQQKGH